MTLPSMVEQHLYLPEHQAFRDTVRRFLEARSIAGSYAWATSPQVLAAAGDYGLLGTSLPEQHGGAGSLDARFAAVVLEEAMSCGLTGFALTALFGSLVVGPLLTRHATGALQEAWLPGLAGGRFRVAVVGLDASRPVCLVAEGTDARLVGSVMAVVGAADADLLLVVAHDETNAPRLVCLEASWATRVPSNVHLAIPGMASADVRFDDTHVLANSLLHGDGASQVAELRADQDLWCALVAVIGAERAQRLTVDYVKARRVFGAALSTFENTQVTLGQVQAQLDSARALVEQGVRARLYALPQAARAAATVLTAVAAYTAAADHGLQLHGGYGYMRDYPIAQAFSDAAALRGFAIPGTKRQKLVAASLGLNDR